MCVKRWKWTYCNVVWFPTINYSSIILMLLLSSIKILSIIIFFRPKYLYNQTIFVKLKFYNHDYNIKRFRTTFRKLPCDPMRFPRWFLQYYFSWLWNSCCLCNCDEWVLEYSLKKGNDLIITPAKPFSQKLVINGVYVFPAGKKLKKLM
jgi:hypothetical protein